MKRSALWLGLLFCNVLTSNLTKEDCEIVPDFIETLLELSKPCSVIDISEFSSKESACLQFEREFLGEKPVILRSNTPNNEILFDITHESVFLQKFGSLSLKVSTQNAETGRVWKEGQINDHFDELIAPVDLKEQYGNNSFYLFGSTFGKEWDDLLSLYKTPYFPTESAELNEDFTRCGVTQERTLSFGIAGMYSGVPFHFHGPVLLEIIHGRKLVLLYPAKYDIKNFDGNERTHQWILKALNLDKNELPIVCDIHEGDILYFPNEYLHATLNLAPYNVFIANFL